jgi:hypothetical protein
VKISFFEIQKRNEEELNRAKALYVAEQTIHTVLFLKN